MIKKITLSLILIFFLLKTSYSQYTYCISIKSESGLILPYSTVLWNNTNGLSADEQGWCTIKSKNKIDSFIVSTVGYERVVKIINSTSFNDTVYATLSEIKKELPEIVIISNGKIEEIGILAKTPNSFIVNQTARHLQEAIRFETEKNISKISSFSIFIDKGSTTDLPLRIRIYRNSSDSLPLDDILTESVILKNYNSNSWNEVSLEDYNIFLKKGTYYAAIEWLCTDQTKQNGLKVGLIVGKGYSQKTYSSIANNKWKSWRCKDQCTNVMIKLKLLQ